MSGSFSSTNKTPSNLMNSPSQFELLSDTKACRKAVDVFENVCVSKVLNKAKSSVYLIKSKVDQQNYAMKVFQYTKKRPNCHFQNEVRFSFANHKNIIRIHHIEYERQILIKESSQKVSYIIMEYAPYGDFFDFILTHKRKINDKLVRTYFRQFIEGLEYLHKNGVSHMDLKLENLLLGEDFNLKIVDFDLSHFSDDSKIISKGTKFYRPPELIQGKCQNTFAVDIYAAGIILFTLKTRGTIPHTEDNCVAGIDFAGLLYSDNQEFWKKHCEIQKTEESFFDQDFKELFNSMIQLNPRERPSIEEIKQSKWFNGPYYTKEELKNEMTKLLGYQS